MADQAGQSLLLAQERAKHDAQQLHDALQGPQPNTEQVRCLCSCLEKNLETLSLRQDEVIRKLDPSELNAKIADMVRISGSLQATCNNGQQWLHKQDIEARISQSVSSDQQVGRVKLPDLKLPSFSGELLKWCEFWDSMKSNIFDVTGLSEVDKFNYLRSALKGEAANLISGIPTTNDNFQQAKDLL